MERATIHWAKGVIEYANIEKSAVINLDYIGFYAILGGVHHAASNTYTNITLLYIGQAYEQSLRTRIPQPHAAYALINTWLTNHPGYTPVVMIGLREAVGNRSQSLYDDIECCLIFNNQPLCNDKCKDSYSGRAITVTNDGDFSPLKQVSACNNSRNP